MLLGRIGAPYGVRGWIKVESFTDPPAALLDYPDWVLAPAGGPAAEPEAGGLLRRRILDGRVHGGKKSLVVHLAGVDDPETARQYTALEVWVPRAELPPAGPNEYYWVDLIGLDVVTLEGIVLGTVSHFVELPANPVLVVCGPREGTERAKEYWVPMAPAHVKRVDLGARRVEVDWDPGV